MDEVVVVKRAGTLVLPERLWLVLRRLAELRALEAGGRPSGAAVVRELLEREAERLGVTRA